MFNKYIVKYITLRMSMQMYNVQCKVEVQKYSRRFKNIILWHKSRIFKV